MKDTMAAHLGGIDFHGNKVLMKKVDSDSKWYKSYKVAAAAHKDFIVSNAYDLLWRGQEADAAKVFESLKGGQASSGASVQQPKKEEAKKPMPAATKVVAKAPAKKEPKHYWRSCQYFWENYEK